MLVLLVRLLLLFVQIVGSAGRLAGSVLSDCCSCFINLLVLSRKLVWPARCACWACLTSLFHLSCQLVWHVWSACWFCLIQLVGHCQVSLLGMSGKPFIPSLTACQTCQVSFLASMVSFLGVSSQLLGPSFSQLFEPDFSLCQFCLVSLSGLGPVQGSLA